MVSRFKFNSIGLGSLIILLIKENAQISANLMTNRYYKYIIQFIWQ